MTEFELLEKAVGIAVTAHRGQKDKHGAPYILHVLRVTARLETVKEKIVAVLHDVVEPGDELEIPGLPEVLEPNRPLTVRDLTRGALRLSALRKRREGTK